MFKHDYGWQEKSARAEIARSGDTSLPTRSYVLSIRARPARVHRWLCSLSKKYYACMGVQKVKKTAGPGRCCLEVWADLCIATVIKRTEKMHVVEVERKLTRGTEEKAQELLALDKGCKKFNTSFIERINGTFRERLASLARKCRHAAARVETLERGMYQCSMHLQLLLSTS